MQAAPLLISAAVAYGAYSGYKAMQQPNVPQITPAVTTPITDDTEAVKAAAAGEAERMKKRRGLASTILTGPQGLEGGANLFKTKLG